MTMMQSALNYAERGWPIFPITPNKKTPLTTNGVHDATTDRMVIIDWWQLWPNANIALNCGAAGYMVLDFDPGHSEAAVINSVGELPKTSLVAQTPRGGYHQYYLLDEHILTPSTQSRIAPHVDVRSHAGYVLLPPSTTEDGVYSWIIEDKPLFATEAMLKVNKKAKERSADHDTWIIPPDTHENLEKAVNWLVREAKIAVEGQGGDGTAYATAAMLKSFGISQEYAVDLMWDHWNPRCDPPWSGDEFTHFASKVRNGYEYNTSPPGNCTEAYRLAKTKGNFTMVKRDLGKGREYTNGRFRIVDRLGMESIRTPSWLIEDCLPSESYAMIFGPPQSFKTFVALDMALTVAAQTVQKSNWMTFGGAKPVVFVAGEGRSSLLRRVQAWEALHYAGNPVEGFRLMDPVPGISLGNADAFDEFLAPLEKMCPDGVSLIVLDTVGRALQGHNENSQEVASAFTAMVQRLIEETGATVLALHHSGHGTDKRARGSSVFEADADVVLRAEAEEQTLMLSMIKQKDGEMWKQRKLLTLTKHHFDEDSSSLVVVPHIEEQTKREAYAQGVNEVNRVILDRVENAVEGFLVGNKVAVYSTTKLANAIACYDFIDAGSSKLRTKYLPLLRESSARKGSRFYDKMKGVWSWKS